MAFPSIKPISPGRDGWSAVYDTDVSRLAYLCGLRAQKIRYSPARQHTVIDWRLDPAAAKKFFAWQGK